MRRFFYLLGAVVAAVIVCAAVALFFFARDGINLDASSKSYTEGAVVAIAGSWSADELWKRASPDFKRATKLDNLTPLFDAADGALGPLLEYQGAKGQAVVSKIVGSDTQIRAQYIAQARFEKGQALFQVSLHQIGNVWTIDGFRIQSTALMNRLTGKPS